MTTVADIVETRRVPLFGFEIDALTMAQAVERIYSWVDTGEKKCRFVVTPNVDHAVLYQEHPGLRQAYDNASLVLADGMPVLAAARFLGHPLPCRVAGSDLAPALFDAAAEFNGLRVFLLGAGAGVAERAAERIHEQWPAVEVVGTYSPPMGFDRDRLENDKIVSMINAVRPDVLIVGLGAPKQELWVNSHHRRLEAGVTLCIGATIDFLAGEKPRAPKWMRATGTEWLFRIATEPRRLLRRYLRGAWIFPQLVWREWMGGFREHKREGMPTGA